MRSKIKFLLVTGLLATLLISACQPKQSASPLGTWILTELNGNAVPSDTNIYMVLENSSLSGSDGCNHFGGSYTLDGNSFSVGDDLMSTLMACEGPIMERADEFNKALQTSAKYQLTDNKLQLLDENGKILAVFEAQSQELAGTSWLATFVMSETSQDVVSSGSIQAAQQTLTFDQEGKLNGNAGCNDYFANYEVDGSTLTISDAGATAMFCGEGLMAEETAFLSALDKVVSYQITGNSLQLRDADDNTLISFTRQ